MSLSRSNSEKSFLNGQDEGSENKTSHGMEDKEREFRIGSLLEGPLVCHLEIFESLCICSFVAQVRVR